MACGGQQAPGHRLGGDQPRRDQGACSLSRHLRPPPLSDPRRSLASPRGNRPPRRRGLGLRKSRGRPGRPHPSGDGVGRDRCQVGQGRRSPDKPRSYFHVNGHQLHGRLVFTDCGHGRCQPSHHNTPTSGCGHRTGQALPPPGDRLGKPAYLRKPDGSRRARVRGHRRPIHLIRHEGDARIHHRLGRPHTRTDARDRKHAASETVGRVV